MVSAYSIRDYFSTISVATSSGMTKFSLIENYRQIGNILAQQINDRQKNTETSAPVATTIAQTDNTADQLKKFKDLLDSGVITQEEFDAKKKQLLGL
ncbi:MAG: SHOCT domain-containing protein [Clostridia bacterium]|nr:SHOCT domain-containing protein [Clostridia bacterium]